MTQSICSIVDLERHPLSKKEFRAQCKRVLDNTGVLVLRRFLQSSALISIRNEGLANQHLAYYATTSHNIYLLPSDPRFSNTHPRNREVISSKGCITSDQIPEASALHALYHDSTFREFLCLVLGVNRLYEYADPLSSVNLHYASEGQELGWHFDNSSFAITLMIQTPEQGGTFQYVADIRNAELGDMNFGLSRKVLDAEIPPKTLDIDAGSLVLFRGRDSIHRVTTIKGNRTRMLVVLAYNTESGISLSESARETFYGRLE